MSKLEKTPNKIASKRKNAITYSFVWFFNDLFQHNKIQVGIKNAVNWIISSARPSNPKIKLILAELNHEYLSISWNSEMAESKKKSKEKQTFKITNDQNNEKLRIKKIWVLSIKLIKIQANKGRKIRFNNIKKR